MITLLVTPVWGLISRSENNESVEEEFIQNNVNAKKRPLNLIKLISLSVYHFYFQHSYYGKWEKSS